MVEPIFNLTDDFGNLTDIQQLMIRIAFQDGKKIGEQIAADVESGILQLPSNETIQIIVDKFHEFEYLPYQKVLAKIGSPKFAVVGNFAFAGGGMAISGTSILKYCKTKNTIARGFYVASSLCGGAAAVAGALKGVEGTCGLSFIAVGGDAFGTAFLFVGNKAQKLGDYIDGKRKWTNFNPRSFLRRRQISKTGMGYRGMSFVTSSGPISFEGVHQIIQRIPYENIIIIGGTIFTVYGYIKILISIYRYLDAKFSPKIDHSQIIHNSALFLINSINNIDSVKKTNRIYIAALKMEYGIVS